jgi:hypothetical protein
LTVVAAVVGAEAAGPRTFATPDEAVKTLMQTVKAGDLPALIAIFGSPGQDLVDTSDPATGRRNREVFLAVMAEGWRLSDVGPGRKELVLGNEQWPFPVPLVEGAAGWSFDAAAGREEILDRRIGRNELAVIEILRAYVVAQRAYASTGHDGKPAGLFARRLGSDPGTHDGPSPFYGYYFRILDGQGDSAKGGAADYVVNGEMSRGFALVAGPVHYDASGVMTFVVSQEGVVYEKDLGPGTDAAARAMRWVLASCTSTTVMGRA